ncbi:hypothetical protein [Neorhizobium galegae]|nr:hypothetical protein [Neorhizobium galegae]
MDDADAPWNLREACPFKGNNWLWEAAMSLTRRQFAALSLSLCFASLSPFRDAQAAEYDNALFWRARFASSEAVLFGYVRSRGDAFPDVVADGKKFIDETSSFLVDVDPGIKFTTTTFDNDDLKPIFLELAKADQEELATIFAGSKSIRSFSKLTALELNILLMGEGQQGFRPDAPSLGHTLFMYAQSLKRPMATLISQDEVKALSKPLTLESANAVGSESVVYLLNLRRRVGPIGAHFDRLYGTRESGEIAKLGEEMASKGVFDLREFIDTGIMRSLLIERLSTLSVGTDAFVTLPIGLLSGPDSICDALRSRGAEVTAIG